MYLHNNYVCHFLQDYWKELVIIAIKSKHNYVMCCAHEKKIIYIFIHQLLSLWFMGFVVECSKTKETNYPKCSVLILNIYHLQGCISSRLRLHPCFVVCYYHQYQCNPLSHSRYIHPGLGPYQWNDKVSTGNWGNLKCEILTRAGARAWTDRAQ